MNRLGPKDGAPSETLYGLHLQACRNEYMSLDHQNQGYAVKTLGTAAFSATVFGISQSSIPDGKIDITTLVLTVLMAATLAVTLLYTYRIIRSKDWESSSNIEEVTEALWSQDCDAQQMETGLYYACAHAVYANQIILDSKARLFDRLASYAGMQFALNAVLLVYVSITRL